MNIQNFINKNSAGEYLVKGALDNYVVYCDNVPQCMVNHASAKLVIVDAENNGDLINVVREALEIEFGQAFSEVLI